jgi:uncharacterized circularly permuted ATP-grasp superfamily protein
VQDGADFAGQGRTIIEADGLAAPAGASHIVEQLNICELIYPDKCELSTRR